MMHRVLFGLAIICASAMAASAQSPLLVSHLDAQFQWDVGTVDATHDAPTEHVLTCGAITNIVPMPNTSIAVKDVVPGPGTYTCTLYAQNSAGRQAEPDVPFPQFESGYVPGIPFQLQVLEQPGTGVPTMAAPTLVDYQQSDWTSRTNADEVTPTVTWQAGDLIVVLGATEDNTMAQISALSATGLTFSTVSGSPTNTNNQVKLYAWTARAAADGSSAVTATRGDTNTQARGIAVFVYRGSDGLGNTAISASLGATTTQSLTRSQANSAIVQVWGDWNATNDTTVTWTPSGQTQRIAQFISGSATFFVADWGDQGSTGTTNYGFSGYAGGAMSAITLEVKGTAGGAASLLVPPSAMAALLVR